MKAATLRFKKFTMMTDLLIVDTSDKVIGHGEKLILHVNGILHRAFSVFIFARNGKQLLLQRRAMHKYHSGGNGATPVARIQGKTH